MQQVPCEPARFAGIEFGSDTVNQAAVGHAGRADRLAGAAGEAAIEVLDHLGLGRECAFGKLLNQLDAPAR